MASSLRADGDGGTTAGVVLPLTLVGSGIYDAYVMSCHVLAISHDSDSLSIL